MLHLLSAAVLGAGVGRVGRGAGRRLRHPQPVDGPRGDRPRPGSQEERTTTGSSSVSNNIRR